MFAIDISHVNGFTAQILPSFTTEAVLCKCDEPSAILLQCCQELRILKFELVLEAVVNFLDNAYVIFHFLLTMFFSVLSPPPSVLISPSFLSIVYAAKFSLSRPCRVLVCSTWVWWLWIQGFSDSMVLGFRGERSSSKETEVERKQWDCKK